MEEAVLFMVVALAGLAALSLAVSLLARIAGRPRGAGAALRLGQVLLAGSAMVPLGELIGDGQQIRATAPPVESVVPVVIVWAALALIEGVRAAPERGLRLLVRPRLEPAPAMLCAAGVVWLATVIVRDGLDAASATAVIAGTGAGLLAGLLLRSAARSVWLGSAVAGVALVAAHLALAGTPWAGLPLLVLALLAVCVPPVSKPAQVHLTREQRA